MASESQGPRHFLDELGFRVQGPRHFLDELGFPVQGPTHFLHGLGFQVQGPRHSLRTLKTGPGDQVYANKQKVSESIPNRSFSKGSQTPSRNLDFKSRQELSQEAFQKRENNPRTTRSIQKATRSSQKQPGAAREISDKPCESAVGGEHSGKRCKASGKRALNSVAAKRLLST